MKISPHLQRLALQMAATVSRFYKAKSTNQSLVTKAEEMSGLSTGIKLCGAAPRMVVK